MTEIEFINWLKGFTQGMHHYSITPKQWDFLKEKLQEVIPTSYPNNKIIQYHLSEAWTTTIT